MRCATSPGENCCAGRWHSLKLLETLAYSALPRVQPRLFSEASIGRRRPRGADGETSGIDSA